jgi:ABC-type multidrug transport system fused ATPase/permease subunit
VLAQAMIVFIGGHMVLDGKLSYGDFAAFSLYLTRLFAPIQQLAQLYNTYQQGRAGVLKLRDLFSTNPSVREKPNARELPPIEGEITLENVTFGYNPSALVLVPTRELASQIVVYPTPGTDVGPLATRLKALGNVTAITSATHDPGSSTRPSGAYMAIMRSRASYVRARLSRRSNNFRRPTNTARVSGTGSPRGTTTVFTADSSTHTTTTAPESTAAIRPTLVTGPGS